MMVTRPYSNDLRRRRSWALDQGKGSQEELTPRLRVIPACTLWKISLTRKHTGRT